ncbi:hypothetical protein Ahy_A04g020562 [Arachis hypogaea]|uniref:Uncharacterized protein n=1 Tax=Arachis hypogaea TaxID=3818 RepID=A0A445DHX1_ARAHY|nr:hypothetical protein Ahy_A04g020562 [Arachis hypogaea]
MLYRVVNPETFKRISKFKTAKEMWDEIHREVANVKMKSATPPQPNNMAPNYNQHDSPIDDFLHDTSNALLSLSPT